MCHALSVDRCRVYVNERNAFPLPEPPAPFGDIPLPSIPPTEASTCAGSRGLAPTRRMPSFPRGAPALSALPIPTPHRSCRRLKPFGDAAKGTADQTRKLPGILDHLHIAPPPLLCPIKALVASSHKVQGKAYQLLDGPRKVSKADAVRGTRSLSCDLMPSDPT